MTASSYERAGVKGQGQALSAVERWLGPTFELPQGARVITGFGHYAAVLRLTDEIAIAVCTDGVGSKTIVASRMGRYDTIGFDCMAMNVNDMICIGARPIALVDYLGVNKLDASLVEAVLEGLGAAAKEAGVAVPGGELAQLPEIIGSDGTSPGDDKAFDLVGTCVGTVHPEKLILGNTIEPGDGIVGLASSGIHSNGLTLARDVLLRTGGYELTDHIERLGRTVGEELLEPTRIYVKAVLDLWSEGIETRGIVHVTGDGFVNLCRLETRSGFRIEQLPEVPEIFGLIQEVGEVPDAEMFRVFNMGVGLAVVVPDDQVTRALDRLGHSGYEAQRIGTVTAGPKEVSIEPVGLVGRLADGESVIEEAR